MSSLGKETKTLILTQDAFGSPTFSIQTARKIKTSEDAIQFIRQLETVDRESVKHIVLDCPATMAKEIIMKHVQSVMLGKLRTIILVKPFMLLFCLFFVDCVSVVVSGRRNYHYLMSGLVLDDGWDSTVEEFGAINMTGLRIVQYGTALARDFFRGFSLRQDKQQGAWARSTRQEQTATISANAALAFDTVNLLINAFSSLMRQNVNLFVTNRRRKAKQADGVGCGDLSGSEGPNTWEHGQKILQEIKNTSFQGLTGHISFDEAGRRKNYTLDVVEMTVRSQMVKVGRWSQEEGLIMSGAGSGARHRPSNRKMA